LPIWPSELTAPLSACSSVCVFVWVGEREGILMRQVSRSSTRRAG
jgi:hypothetical protein